ncbi:hypothetical protein [Streptomyces lasalocidi]|uniref:Uncharacterized protein n=1 Tax=Streptomyces lasalocidi TaxID=324833 RepID=A0A4V6AWE8_STRLS|nr:hypothetical protein [Streptomyces lasalocidi]TKT03593.1 hypothetical protein E4U91_28285 [Streptomyces lasalocidi]
MTRKTPTIGFLRALSTPALLAYLLIEKVLSRLVSTSQKRAHRLASAEAARQARKTSEARLRTMAATYAEWTPLELRLLIIDDYCTPGTLDWELFGPRWPAYKVRCFMRLTGYYTSPLPVPDTIEAILTAGDQPLSPIPFSHARNRKETDLTPGPPGNMSHAGHVLDWDRPGFTLKAPEDYPAAYRRICDPPVTTVTAIRVQHGVIYRLTLPVFDYYRIPR